MRVTDPQKIREVLDGFIKEPPKRDFITLIFSREHRPGGIEYVCFRPISACEMDGQRTYTLSTSDTNYQLGQLILKLSGIEYILL